MSDPSYHQFDDNEIENREHDSDLAVKKVILYGWDGSQAVALKVDINGVVGVTVG